MTGRCRLCHATGLIKLIDFGRTPIAHRLPSDPAETEALYPFSLELCESCGLVQVVEPIDPEILYGDFNYNFSSWKAEPHREAELDTIEAAGPHRSVVEIGSNDGLFLKALRDRGIETVVGIEPNPVSGGRAEADGLTIYRSLLTEAVREEVLARHGAFDLVVTRQVTEHVIGLEAFFENIRQLLKPDGLLFLDVPDFTPALSLGDCSVLWEEHVSYFTEPVLRTLLARSGFRPLRFDRYDFSGGTLAVLARREDSTDLAADSAGVLPQHVEEARGYGKRVRDYVSRLRETLSAARSRGVEVALYGVGVRGCGAVNFLQIGDLIDVAIDDQAERQGKFMPGSKLPIRPSESLGERDGPLLCLLAVNNENEAKVVARARAAAKRPMDFVSLCAPRDIWRELEALQVEA